MAKQKIVDAVKGGKVLISDGAWGTFLQKKGLKPGECPELWAVERPADVKEIAQAYFAAGADMVESDTFGGTSFKLEHFGLKDRVAEINQAAAKLSAEAAVEAGGTKWVIASVGPTGKMLVMEEVTEEELYNCFKDQVVALAKGGADAICIETMSDIEEAALAVKAVKENTSCEAIATFTFSRTVNGDYRTMMGVSPEQAAEAMLEAGADIIGTNCGNGIERMIEIVKVMRKAAPATPILVHANAGLPKNVNGVDTFPETPEMMAAQVHGLVAAGANIIGGCCGTTPAHIKAMKDAVKA
ncbi:MAG: homocysteine S-methyltransferase family protein [Kiritimatiellales bacterium]|jgi:5-methyltetrahydrofolate--homocysteine methyltransferase